MTWLERDNARERIEWIASAHAVARMRELREKERVRLDSPDVLFQQLVQAAVEVTPINDAHNVGVLDAWDYREWVNSGGCMTINASCDMVALAILVASLTRIPPKP